MTTPEVQIENALGRTEAWFEANWKRLMTCLVVVLVVVGAALFWYHAIHLPKGRKAAEAMFVAEQMFIAGDYRAALDGDGVSDGFVGVVARYGGTKQGRLAAHYAGVCFVKLGEWDSALEYLKKYTSVKGIPGAIVNAQNAGLQGDVYVQKGDYASAVECFTLAVELSDNAVTAPAYLKKLGLALDATGDYAGAAAAYKRVSEEYPSSLEARDIDKLRGEVEQK